MVLEAWRQWGPGCLRKFRGMFAFAMFDEVSGSLFLARDHLGIKPLHFIRRDGGVVFASELKALVAAFGHELEIEPSALIASILYYWVPDRRCSLSGVEKLQPGTWAEFRPDGTCPNENILRYSRGRRRRRRLARRSTCAKLSSLQWPPISSLTSRSPAFFPEASILGS